MKDTYTIPLDLTLKEWYKLNFLFLRFSSLKRLFLGLIGTQIVLDIYWLPLLLDNHVFNFKDLFQLVMIPLGPFTFMFFGVLIGGLYLNKFKPEAIRGTITRYSHWGVEVSSYKTDQSVPWRQFIRLRETKDFLLITFKLEGNNTIAFHPVLKRTFADKAELNAFKTFVEQQLSRPNATQNSAPH